MKYLHWDQQTITDFSDNKTSEMYEKGYVFTRIGKGVMHQTRSIRINLGKFKLSSENRRILKKTEGVSLNELQLPILVESYDYRIGKMAKDFYDTKFGPGIMSAQKVKEILTDAGKSNFNYLIEYGAGEEELVPESTGRRVLAPPSLSASSASERLSGVTSFSSASGYSICFKNNFLLHYSYPFYELQGVPKDMGLGMMVRAIDHAQKAGLKYVYLGSLQRPSDTYKLQFEGIEWFDGKEWQTEIEEAKKILAEV